MVTSFFLIAGLFADAKPPEPIRGVWLTNVASDALCSRKNIRDAVERSSKLGFNTIFVVTWNRGYTLYPSKVLQSVTNTLIDPAFKGRDPLQELIEEAAKKNIKVHAWFEFGFSSSYEDSTGGPIIKARPHWASLDNEGKLTSKNRFQWMNAFHPEVQDFITDLVLEVVQNYAVAGIQGDDRLPALPSNGGYDEYTVSLYKKEHAGEPPPQNEKDYEWIKWRSGKLNVFLKELVDTVKSVKPEVLISMAPSIYPWSEENYLQDWPTWLSMGLVDVIIPQVYRYNLDRYTHEMDKILKLQISEKDKKKFFPGILLQVDDYNPSQKLLSDMIKYNRDHGIQGEVFFFYEGIKKYESFFKELYKDEVVNGN